jgi:predicted RNA binding protein YcfA (HicA-like mRNA interferase family)
MVGIYILKKEAISSTHLIKKGRVTIPDHGKNDDLDHKVVKSIMIQAKLK